jgi:hypothetical protein
MLRDIYDVLRGYMGLSFLLLVIGVLIAVVLVVGLVRRRRRVRR